MLNKTMELNDFIIQLNKIPLVFFASPAVVLVFPLKKSSADKVIEIVTDEFEKRILSLSSTGKVREYQLNYFISYRIKTLSGEWGPEIKIKSRRVYSYNDQNIVAKQQEEENLIKGMKEQIIRTMTSQISSAK